MCNIISDRWVNGFILAVFNSKIGPTPELIYPNELSLSKSLIKTICCIAFPETLNIKKTSKTYFIYRIRDINIYSDDIKNNDMKIPIKEEYNIKEIKYSQLKSLYCYVYYQQWEDSSSPRGYSQKAFITMSNVLHIDLLGGLTIKLGLQLLSLEKRYKLDDEYISLNLLKQSYENIEKWPQPSVFFYPYTALHSCIYDSHMAYILQQNKIVSKNYKDEIYTQISMHNQLKYNPSWYIYPDKEKYTSTVKFLDETFDITSPYPSPLEYPQLSSSLQTPKYAGLSSLLSVCAQPSSCCKINLYSIFGPKLLPRLWEIWELLLYGRPISILGESICGTSLAILGLSGLIAPLPYYGLTIPHLSIYDKELDIIQSIFTTVQTTENVDLNIRWKNVYTTYNDIQISPGSYKNAIDTSIGPLLSNYSTKENISSLNILVGITNPFVLARLQPFPNVIYLGCELSESESFERSIHKITFPKPYIHEIDTLNLRDKLCRKQKSLIKYKEFLDTDTSEPDETCELQEDFIETVPLSRENDEIIQEESIEMKIQEKNYSNYDHILHSIPKTNIINDTSSISISSNNSNSLSSFSTDSNNLSYSYDINRTKIIKEIVPNTFTDTLIEDDLKSPSVNNTINSTNQKDDTVSYVSLESYIYISDKGQMMKPIDDVLDILLPINITNKKDKQYPHCASYFKNDLISDDICEINSSILQQHFFCLTSAFIAPFAKYLAPAPAIYTLFKMVTFNPYLIKPLPPFSCEAFQNDITRDHTSIKPFFDIVKSKKRKGLTIQKVINIYANFISTPHFNLWASECLENTEIILCKIRKYVILRIYLYDKIFSFYNNENRINIIQGLTKNLSTEQILQMLTNATYLQETDSIKTDTQFYKIVSVHKQQIEKLV